GGRHVCRRTSGAAPFAAGTLPLLPVRRTHGAPGWLCRSGCRLLWRTAGLDRTAGEGAVERSLRSFAGSQNRPATARALAPETRTACDPGTRSFPANLARRAATVEPCPESRAAYRTTLSASSPAAR